MPLQQLLDKFIHADNANECWEYLLQALKPLGIDGGLLVYAPLVDSDSAFFFYNNHYSSAFFQDYLSNGGGVNDPCVQIACNNKAALKNHSSTALMRWDHIDQFLSNNPHLINKNTERMDEISQDHQLNAGLTFVIETPSTHSSWLGLGLGSRGMSHKEFECEVIPHLEFIQQCLTLFQSSLLRFPLYGFQQLQSLPELSERQINILQGLAMGMRHSDIAKQQVHRSVAQLDKDIRTLKNLLRAKTLEELVAISLLRGLIELPSCG
ncbi:MAG: autoinducer binding domain-containing protein [Oleibacter sp.]|nr:autoinducer binding domain-containing protein [Thalassolituus sp.]